MRLGIRVPCASESRPRLRRPVSVPRTRQSNDTGACHATDDDEDEDHVPHKDITESQDDEFARSVRVRDAFIAVDIDQRLLRAEVSASRPDRLTFEPGDMCYFWQDGVGWSPGMGHCGVSSCSRPLLC